MHKEVWDDLRFVLAVAEAGSVNAATRRLGVNHATVLRRVGAFESRHGVAIFSRNATGYTVDPACLPVIDAIRQVSTAVDGVERALAKRDLQVSGPLKLTTTDTLAHSILPRLMPDIVARFPGLHVNVEVTNARLNMSRLDAELTIRPALALPADLVGERVCSMMFAVYGRGEAARAVEPAWIGISGALENSPITAWQARLDADRIICTASSFPAMAALAAAGLGLAMLPCCLGDQTRGLRRSAAVLDELETGVWVASHRDLAEVPRIARSRDVFVAGLKGLTPVLEGHAGTAA